MTNESANHDRHSATANPTPARIDDWETWLDVSATPPTTSRTRATVRHYVNDGHLVDNDLWPTEGGCQIYAAFDDTSTVYVGQTTMALAKRIRKHFGNQQTKMQRRKAGTWRFIITATFPGLAPSSSTASNGPQPTGYCHYATAPVTHTSNQDSTTKPPPAAHPCNSTPGTSPRKRRQPHRTHAGRPNKHEWTAVQKRLLLSVVVLLHDAGRDPTAVRNLDALRLGPRPDLRQVSPSGGRSLPSTTPPGLARRRVTIRLDRLLERSPVLLRQVDGVIDTIERERHLLRSGRSVEVVGDMGNYSSCHARMVHQFGAYHQASDERCDDEGLDMPQPPSCSTHR